MFNYVLVILIEVHQTVLSVENLCESGSLKLWIQSLRGGGVPRPV
jgi:hypothetical protein